MPDNTLNERRPLPFAFFPVLITKPYIHDGHVNGGDYVYELRLSASLFFIPHVIYNIDSHGAKISTGEDSLFFHQSFLAILPAEPSSSKAGINGEGNYKFDSSKYFCSYLQVIFHVL
jgi:hypothetical protein